LKVVFEMLLTDISDIGLKIPDTNTFPKL